MTDPVLTLRDASLAFGPRTLWSGLDLDVHEVEPYVGTDPRVQPLAGAPKYTGNVGVDYRQFGAVFETGAAARELDELLSWVSKGDLNVPVGRTFPFGKYRDKYDQAQQGQAHHRATVFAKRGPEGGQRGRRSLNRFDRACLNLRITDHDGSSD